MSQPYDRVFNFSAGPCTLPVPVLEQARDEIMNYRGTGMSVMEMSHRSKAFETILEEAANDFRTLVGVPDNYKILFLQGGASMQFSMVPMCFLGEGQTADYVTTGTWGKKSIESAQLVGNARSLYDGKSHNYSEVPDLASLDYTPNGAYMHFTSNETIQGVQFKSDPTMPGTVVCDMSSDILSRSVDVSKYALIYAGAQKNMGPAGTTVVIIRDDLIERVPTNLSPMLDYRVQAENGSMYNTPPCWGIYMCGLMYKYLLGIGGLQEMQRRNEAKCKVLYDAIDGSNGFFKGHAKADCRSTMNVTFTLPDEELTKEFIKLTESRKLDGLKGHRSVGGIRASIYNSFPAEGCEVLAETMREFAAQKAEVALSK